MDRSHLYTIVITALVTVIFREVFTWIVALAKLTATKPATKEHARKLFRGKNIYLAANCAYVVWAVWKLIKMTLATTPVTHVDVLTVSLSVLSIFAAVAMIVFTLATSAAFRKIDEMKELRKAAQPFMRETGGGPVE